MGLDDDEGLDEDEEGLDEEGLDEEEDEGLEDEEEEDPKEVGRLREAARADKSSWPDMVDWESMGEGCHDRLSTIIDSNDAVYAMMVTMVSGMPGMNTPLWKDLEGWRR